MNSCIVIFISYVCSWRVITEVIIFMLINVIRRVFDWFSQYIAVDLIRLFIKMQQI